jgi:hypothetical protein
MAITNNGQPVSQIAFTDDRVGNRVFFGPNTPTNPSDGDIWFDSDSLNNAGKNLISSFSLPAGGSTDLTIPTIYKDTFIIIRNIQVSATANLLVTLNGVSSAGAYSSGTALFTVSNLKTAVTTNEIMFTLPDSQDTASFQYASMQGVYTDSTNANTVLNTTSAFLQTAALTKLTLTLSAGNFSGGTALVYGVN